MKGKGYRSNVAKAVWIVIVHLAAVAAVICAAFFVMIYQTGIRLDDRGKSYIQSEGFRERLNSRGTDILESLSAKEDINYLTNAGSSAVIDLAEFKEKEINRDSLREEHEPSFKVNTDRNLWYDFGAGKGGNIIALAKELYCSDSLPYLLNRIAEQTPHVRPVSFSFPQRRTEPSFQHLEVRDLTHPALLRYLEGRGINIELAKRECKELHFTNNGRPFFAIGFPNIAGGYEVRNSFFKGCIAPKDITHIRQQGEPREKCLVFEGFMDYLSFLTLRMKNCPTMPDLDRQDYVILNSTVNVPKAIDVLYPYERIHCMLDNDKAGYEATRAIELEYSYRVRDFSGNYRGYSDLNDYLCGRKQEQKNSTSQAQEIKQETGQRAAPRQKRGRGI